MEYPNNRRDQKHTQSKFLFFQSVHSYIHTSAVLYLSDSCRDIVDTAFRYWSGLRCFYVINQSLLGMNEGQTIDHIELKANFSLAHKRYKQRTSEGRSQIKAAKWVFKVIIMMNNMILIRQSLRLKRFLTKILLCGFHLVYFQASTLSRSRSRLPTLSGKTSRGLHACLRNVNVCWSLVWDN